MSETLGDIRQRAEAATEGPWDMKECHPCTNRGRLDVSVWANGGNTEVAGWCDDDEFTRSDAEFIAHARTDIPRVLAALDAVLALHESSGPQSCPIFCKSCGFRYPCPTVAAVNDALEAGK